MTANQPFAFRNGVGRPENRPAILDLFSGVGGLSLGFLMAGFRVALAVDNDDDAVACYNANLKSACDGGAVQYDLANINSHEDVEEFLKSQGIEPQSLTAVVGGPPCQGFAMIGRTKLNALLKKADKEERVMLQRRDKRRCALFETFALFVEVVTPEWFLFENVPTIRNHKVYRKLLSRFHNLRSPDGEKLDYEILPDVYAASDYGVPQKRHRFILVGRLRTSESEWVPPRKRNVPATVAEALDDLPWIKAGAQNPIVKYSKKPTGSFQKLMHSGFLPGESRDIHNHICRGHETDDIKLFRLMRQGQRFADEAVQKAIVEVNPKHHLRSYSCENFTDKLHRLEASRPCWTITAHLQKDGYKFIHYRQGRTISVREAARLQSFPDWFRFGGLGMGSAFRLIGNAVPPLMARAFAQKMLNIRRNKLTAKADSSKNEA